MGAESAAALKTAAGVTQNALGDGLYEMALFSGENHAPSPLTADETALLSAFSDEGAPDWVRADVPEWLWPSFERGFGETAMAEGRALVDERCALLQRGGPDFFAQALAGRIDPRDREGRSLRRRAVSVRVRAEVMPKVLRGHAGARVAINGGRRGNIDDGRRRVGKVPAKPRQGAVEHQNPFVELALAQIGRRNLQFGRPDGRA